MKNNYFKVKLYPIILVAGLLMNACKEPDDIGLNIQPTGDMLNYVISDTTSIVAYSFKIDSVPSSISYLNLLGSIKDPIFGTVNAGFCTEFEPQSFNIKFGDSPVVDSMILVLAYNSYYGDTTTSQTVKVYELNDTIPSIEKTRDTIFSDYYVPYDIFSEIASYSFKPRPKSKIKVDTATELAQLRIRLNNNFAETFLNADTTSNTGIYSSVEKFQEFLKGLYITATPVNSDGAICYFDLKKTQNNKYVSKLILYFHNSTEDSLFQSFVIGRNSMKFNKFDHNNFLDAIQILRDQINGNKSLGDSLLFLQSISGPSVKLKFPYLLNWYNNGKILINRAELIFTAEETGTYMDEYYASPKLSLALAGTEAVPPFHYGNIIDWWSGDTFFGGTYDSSKKEYHFNITRQIQNFLTKNNPDNVLFLTISGNAVNSTRVVIKGSKRSVGRLRLNLIYTKLY